MPNQPPPRNAGKAAIVIVAIVAAIIIMIMVGLNTSHFNVKEHEKRGEPAIDSAKKGPQDLGTENQQ